MTKKCKNCGQNDGVDTSGEFVGRCSYCGCEVDGKEPTNGEKYVRDAMRAGFTREQAVWLHNEFYDVKAI